MRSFYLKNIKDEFRAALELKVSNNRTSNISSSIATRIDFFEELI